MRGHACVSSSPGMVSRRWISTSLLLLLLPWPGPFMHSIVPMLHHLPVMTDKIKLPPLFGCENDHAVGGASRRRRRRGRRRGGGGEEKEEEEEGVEEEDEEKYPGRTSRV